MALLPRVGGNGKGERGRTDEGSAKGFGGRRQLRHAHHARAHLGARGLRRAGAGRRVDARRPPRRPDPLAGHPRRHAARRRRLHGAEEHPCLGPHAGAAGAEADRAGRRRLHLARLDRRLRLLHEQAVRYRRPPLRGAQPRRGGCCVTYSFAIERPRAMRALAAFVVALALVVSVTPAVQALGRMVSVIVEGSNAQQAADLTTSVHGTVDNFLPIVGGVQAHVPSSRIADLSTRALVFPDRAMKLQGNNYGGNLVSAYPSEVGARQLWTGQSTGAGVTVALVDTGIADVPDLADHVVARANFTKETSFLDTFGHGTFEAGLVAGDGT